VIGFLLSILPGGGAVLSSFVSYAVEKRVAKHPERFGQGAIEGVAAPEAANNSAAQSAFIPLLTLGLPANVVMALLLGALILHGVTPGSLLLTKNPDIFWGVVASMYLGNIMLLILNLPLIGLWVQLLRIPYLYLMPAIVLLCIVGAYTVANSVTDAYLMLGFGVLGYLRLSDEEAQVRCPSAGPGLCARPPDRVLLQIGFDVFTRQLRRLFHPTDQFGVLHHHRCHSTLFCRLLLTQALQASFAHSSLRERMRLPRQHPYQLKSL
jgi:hypothetical protein